MASSSNDFKLSSRWMYALLFGAPVAAYIGYRFMKTSDTPSDKTSKDSKSTSTEGTSNGNTSALKSEDPTDIARDHKLEGNKYFRSGQFEKAIERYTEAIKECPKSETQDLSTFYQNRAAAYEQLRNHERVVEDCTSAIELNPKYLKALQRRANAYEKLNRLADALDDVTAVCLLEAFQNESTLIQADRVLKELGRQHAKEAMEKRQPVLPSTSFIKAFLSSFSQDPIVHLIASKESQSSENLSGFERAKQALVNQEYSQVIPACTEEINDSVEADSQTTVGALLLRATFYMMMGEQKNALADLEAVIENDQADIKHRVNALIKRASLHIQTNDPEKCLEDYERAVTLDPNNPDIYHHRGQMEVLLDKAEEAMRDFEKAVELNPDYPMAYAQKCFTDFRYKYLFARNMSALDEILSNFHDGIKRFPKCTECYMLLAQVLSELERFEDADKYFVKAMEIDPANPTLYVHRGLLQLRWKNNSDEAVKMLNKAIKLDEKCELAYETLGTIEVQRGRMDKAIEYFDTAIPLAKSETEMSHLFSLRDATVSQARVAARMGVFIPSRAYT